MLAAALLGKLMTVPAFAAVRMTHGLIDPPRLDAASSQCACLEAVPTSKPRVWKQHKPVHRALRADKEELSLGAGLHVGRRATSSRFESTLLDSWDDADDERTLIWRGVSWGMEDKFKYVFSPATTVYTVDGAMNSRLGVWSSKLCPQEWICRAQLTAVM
jgi:hypothetical protein